MVRIFDKFGEEEKFISEKELQSQLFASIKLGDVDEAEQAIVRGAKLNYTYSSGNTPLHLAIYENNEEMVSLLLKYGADVNYTDFSGNTPLDAAISSKNSKIIEMLLRAKEGHVDFINFAIKSNKPELLKLLVQNGYKHPLTEQNLKGIAEYIPFSMKPVVHTYQFLYNTGYYKSNQYVPQKVLDASIAVSNFIENKTSRSQDFNKLKKTVPTSILLSQLAYEYRSDKSLLSYFIEVVQFAAAQLDSNEEKIYTTHAQKLMHERTNQKNDSRIKS